MEYGVRAHNTATESTNKIHSDEIARQFGFRGGLVPGVDVYAYMCHLPAERWGRAWLERGTMTVRLASPVYDGDDITIAGSDQGEDSLGLVLTDSAGATCAEGRASLPPRAVDPPSIEDWPDGEPPDLLPPASAEALTSRPLGSLAVRFHAERAGEYLDDVREHLALFRDDGLAHPGWLLRGANNVLAANVRLGPWIHVESEVRFHGVVTDGDLVETRALVTDERERKGHRFVTLDVLQIVADRPVTRTTHTAIYQPRIERAATDA